MDNEDLNDILFKSTAPGGGPSQPTSKCMTPHSNFYASTMTNNMHPAQLPNKSNNKTREDLEELIAGIPFPNDDLSFTSLNSGHSHNTPQKFNQQYQDRQFNISNRHQQHASEDLKPSMIKPNMKSVQNNNNPKQGMGFPSDNRMPHGYFQSSNNQRPGNFDFEQNAITEENTNTDSMTPGHLNKFIDWTKQHVTPGDSKSLFPQVVAPSIDISGDGSLLQSRNNHRDRFEMAKYSPNENQDISIDNIHEKEPLNEQNNRDNRVLTAAGDSLLRIELKRCQDQLGAAENELNFQKKKYSKLEQENNYLTHLRNDLEDHLQFIQEKYNDHTSLDTLRGRNLANAKTQLKQVKGLLEKKEEKIAELMSQVQQMKKNEQIYKEAVETEVMNLRLEIERAKILAQSHLDRLNEAEGKTKAAYEQSMKKDHHIESLNAQLKGKDDKMNELRSELQRNQGTIDKLHNHIGELEHWFNEATSKLEEKEKEVEKLKNQNENFLMEQHKLSSLESDKVWEQRYSELKEELTRVKESKDRELIKLKEMVTQQKEQLRGAQEALMRKEAEINNMSNMQAGKNFNVLDQLLQNDDYNSNSKALAAKEEELRNQKAQYDRDVHQYRAQIEDLVQKVQSLENDRIFSGMDRNSQMYSSRLSAGSAKGDKVNISQAVNCTLYLEPLQNLMNSLRIHTGGNESKYEEEIKKIADYINELNMAVQNAEKSIVEFKKRQISINSELDCTKMENEQLKENMKDMQEKDAENAEKLIYLHSEIADLKKTIVSLEAQTRFGSFLGGSPRSTKSRRDNDMFRDQDEDLSQEYLQLKEDYKALENDYTSAKENLQKLQMKCKELELELKRSASQYQRSQDELELVKMELETKSTTEKSHWEAMKKSLNDKVKGLEQKNENLMEEIRKRELNIAELKGKLEIAEVEAKNNEQEYSHYLEETSKDISGKISQLEKKNKELSGEAQQKQEEINRLKLRIKELDYELEQERMNNQEELRKRQQKYLGLEQEVFNLREENVALGDQVNRLNDIVEKRDVELNRVLNEKQAIMFENERLALGIDKEKNREDVLGRMNEALSTREKQLIEMKGKVEDLSFELKKEKEKFLKLKDSETEKERQLAEVSSRLREKENELKFVVESARKKESQDMKTSSELNSKKQELEKIQSAYSLIEKELEALKKEKNELKKVVEASQQNVEKMEKEMKKKEEAVKKAEDNYKKKVQEVEDKNKANLKLFNVNKELSESLKTLEETHNNLKGEFEKKNKMLAQRMSEIKTLTQKNKSLEDSNNELNNEVMELKIKLQQIENDISNKKVQQLKNENLNESLSHIESHFDSQANDRETRESVRTRESERNDKYKHEMERLLKSFSEREAQFEHIKQSFIEKMMGLTEKIAFFEQKCATLAEENNSLSSQIGLYQNSNETLKEKINTIENNFKLAQQWNLFNDSGIEFMNKMETRRDPLGSMRKTQNGFEDFVDEAGDMDEMKPPRGYETNPFRLTGFSKNGGEYDTKSTLPRIDEKATTNVFANNVLDMISPEMLSTEETISLMLEILRRASQSHKLAVTLGTNPEFKDLTNTIRKQCILEEQASYTYNENSSFSGKIRRQNRQNESYYSKNG